MGAGAAMLVAQAIEPALVAKWLAAIDQRHAEAAVHVDADADVDRHSSSLRLRSIIAIDMTAVLAAAWRGAVAAICRDTLGPSVACDADQCWARRQYPLGRYPPHHAAHSWHQDGALGFDFLAHAGIAISADALLPMLTCWIALTPCGVDAPGLELAKRADDSLMPLAALTDAAVRAAHAPEHFERPAMQAGDALVFSGGVLHHTHVTAAMTRERTSVELRFFDASRIPDRLRGDRFLAMH
jgi:hypothetical protein